jgi:tetratricopeptide (TPR) repeat protein
VIELLLEAERALSFGRVDRAEQLYRQVADADPRNSIAIVGLGRVALERADDLGAYLLARRALAIDPENDAARRLATRLEEVLATRGEPVADPMPTQGVQAAPTTMATQAARAGAPAPAIDDIAPSTPGPAAPAPAPRSRSLLDRLRRR